VSPTPKEGKSGKSILHAFWKTQNRLIESHPRGGVGISFNLKRKGGKEEKEEESPFSQGGKSKGIRKIRGDGTGKREVRGVGGG